VLQVLAHLQLLVFKGAQCACAELACHISAQYQSWVPVKRQMLEISSMFTSLAKGRLVLVGKQCLYMTGFKVEWNFRMLKQESLRKLT
jgi:hypothetical protein